MDFSISILKLQSPRKVHECSALRYAIVKIITPRLKSKHLVSLFNFYRCFHKNEITSQNINTSPSSHLQYKMPFRAREEPGLKLTSRGRLGCSKFHGAPTTGVASGLVERLKHALLQFNQTPRARVSCKGQLSDFRTLFYSDTRLPFK